MLNSKKICMAACVALALGVSATALADEINEYTLSKMNVYGDKVVKDKFQNVVTEQSYYRTGGDVDVVSREEIEKKHYTSLTDAIRSLPGVRVSNTGYRGIDYGDGWDYNNTFSINGDSKVVVLVDGKRVDNSVSSMITGQSSQNSGGSVVLDNVMDIENVERIEVIKGPGASVYGSDATGGVINIITRRVGAQSSGTIDLSTGSWDRHNYAINYRGTTGGEDAFKYVVSANRRMGGNSKYHDGQTGKNYTFLGTDYKEDSAYIKLDKDFDKTHNVRFTYNYGGGRAGNPYLAPDYTVADIKKNFRPAYPSDPWNHGYRNTFLTYALTGGRYGVYNKNDYDITYTFDKTNGMESFVRTYWNTRKYAAAGGYYTQEWPDETIYPGGIFNPDWQAEHYRSWKNPTSWSQQQGRGVQVQLAKSIGIHDIITSWTYDKSKFNSIRLEGNKYRPAGTTTTERDSITGYVQDKIHLSDKLELSPAIRYSHFKNTTVDSPTGGSTTVDNTGSSQITPILSSQYAFDDTFSTYMSWTRVYRPIKQSDYTSTVVFGDKLQDEKGNVYTWGLKKEFNDKTNLNMNIAYTKMSNMIGYFSVLPEGADEPVAAAVNARQEKKAFNLGINHDFDDHLSLGATYSYVHEKVRGKGNYSIEYGNKFDGRYYQLSVDNMLNKITPPNQYTLNVSYDNRDFNASLGTLIYSGASTDCYTDHKFTVVNFSSNYKIKKNITAYFAINNIFNEAYQTKYSSHTGKGAYPELGRNFMVGMKYTF